jgi:hypothetical protein
MIRHTQGDSFLLIKQHDHALLSGQVAEKIGNGMFAPPSPFQAVVDGIGLHDCGWPIHDDEAPTLNKEGLPLHVLESPMDLAVKVWTESARRAAEKDPYTGLLVSLHVTALSHYAQTAGFLPNVRPKSATEQFLLNKFQQKQFEHQENLRRALKMPTDLPLHNGLAELGLDDAEDLLLFNFGLVKLLDRVSLDLCCSEDLFDRIEDVYPQPGDSPTTIKIRHTGPGAMELSPWPFAAERLEFEIPCRRVARMKYVSDEAFREVYRNAPTESYRVSVAAY